MLRSWPIRPGCERDDQEGHHAGHVGHDRGESEDGDVGAGRGEVLLGEDLEAVDDAHRRAPRPDPIGPDAQVHAGDDLELEIDQDEGRRDRHQQDGRGRDDESDERQVGPEEVEERRA